MALTLGGVLKGDFTNFQLLMCDDRHFAPSVYTIQYTCTVRSDHCQAIIAFDLKLQTKEFFRIFKCSLGAPYIKR